MGRNTIFTLPKKVKDEERISRMSKKIQKKDKHIINLQNAIKRNVERKALIAKRKEDLSTEIAKQGSKMEIEAKAITKAEMSRKIDEL